MTMQETTLDFLHLHVGCEVIYEVQQPTPILFVVQVQEASDQRVLHQSRVIDPLVAVVARARGRI